MEGAFGANFRDRLVKLRRDDGRNHLDASQALYLFDGLGDLMWRHARRIEHFLADQVQCTPSGSQFNAGCTAVEQPRSGMFLEPLERGTDCRLLPVQTPRRRADTARLDNIDK